jgi:nitrogenase molybdenum-iron protein alpha/beta subunit
MRPKEKAEELILKFMRLQEPNYNWFHSKLAKKCALIAVDDILEVLYSLKFGNALSEELEYWEEVKEKIKKL